MKFFLCMSLLVAAASASGLIGSPLSYSAPFASVGAGYGVAPLATTAFHAAPIAAAIHAPVVRTFAPVATAIHAPLTTSIGYGHGLGLGHGIGYGAGLAAPLAYSGASLGYGHGYGAGILGNQYNGLYGAGFLKKKK